MQNPTFWDMLADTPWWVYLIFSYLFWAAYQATKSRIISTRQLYINSVFLSGFCLLILCLLMPLSLQDGLIWVGGLSAGMPLGWLQFKQSGVRALQGEAKLYVPGTRLVFLLVLAIPFLRYQLGSQLFSVDVLKNPNYRQLMISLCGLGPGLSLGRFLQVRNCFKKGL